MAPSPPPLTSSGQRGLLSPCRGAPPGPSRLPGASPALRAFAFRLLLVLLRCRFLFLLRFLLFVLLLRLSLILLAEVGSAVTERVRERLHAASRSRCHCLAAGLEELPFQLVLHFGHLRDLPQHAHSLGSELARLKAQPFARQISPHTQRELALLRAAQYVSAEKGRGESQLGLIVHAHVTFNVPAGPTLAVRTAALWLSEVSALTVATADFGSATKGEPDPVHSGPTLHSPAVAATTNGRLGTRAIT